MAADSSALYEKGYPLKVFVGKRDPKFHCNMCGLVLRDPVQNFCGHRFCRSCIMAAVSGNVPVPCDTCSKEGIEEGEFSMIRGDQIFPDNAVKREMSNLNAKCFLASCTWQGIFKLLEEHLANCPFKEIMCENCNTTLLQKNIAEHREKKCPNRKISCKHCLEEVNFVDRKIHNKTCPKFPMKCEFCGKEPIAREMLEQHNEKDCPNPRVVCPLCQIQMNRDDLKEHLQDNLGDHFNLILEKMENLKVSVIEAVNAHTNAATVGQISQKLTQLEERIHIIEDELHQATKNKPISEQSFKRLENRVSANETKAGAFEGIVGIVHKEAERCLNAIQELNEQRHLEKDQIENLDRKVKQLERSITTKDATIAEHNLRFDCLELGSYDGTLLWKIDKFSQRKQDSASGRATSLYSPPFFTSRRGYKMCARLYPNGDGIGKGSHISLFFVLMKGPYDALLPWPFQQKVTFFLLDQGKSQGHVVDAFRPDIKSSSFKRPTSDMNIASGCPQLILLNTLQNSTSTFIKDDTMFVKCIVDMTNIANL